MKTCALDGCEAGLDHLRSHATYCSPAHREEARRGRVWAERSRRFWTGYLRAIRRGGSLHRHGGGRHA